MLPLGAGQEVGRSCIIVRYGGKTVMLDCGVHPGFYGLASLPFFDEVDLSEVDVMLVTHFHLDHCAAVPYVTGHTPFRGRVLMTHATKAIVHTLLKDFVKVSRGGGSGGWLLGAGRGWTLLPRCRCCCCWPHCATSATLLLPVLGGLTAFAVALDNPRQPLFVVCVPVNINDHLVCIHCFVGCRLFAQC